MLIRLVVVTLLLLPEATMADTPPDSLIAALRLWSLGLVQGAGDVVVTPANGRYAVAVPVQGPIGQDGVRLEGDPITTTASPAAGATWRLEAIALPSPVRLVGPHLNLNAAIASQSGSATIDPTLRTPSTGEVTRSGITLRDDLGSVPSVLTIARVSSHVDWMPAAPGRVDTAAVTLAESLLWKKAPADSVSAGSLSMTFQSTDADPDRAATLLRHAVTFVNGVDPDATLTLNQRQDLHALLAQTHHLARQAKLTLEARDVSVASGDRPFTLGRLSLSQVLTAPDDKLTARLRLELTDLDVPGMPKGSLHDLLPHRIVLAPSVTGAAVADLYTLADRWIDDAHDPSGMAEDAERRLAASPVTVGFDEVSFDLGPALLHGEGRVTVSAPGAMDGTATIRATGLDALIKRMSADPFLKHSVALLIFLKGVGEQNGDTVEWKVAYHNGKLTVNGTDLSMLIPPR